MNQEKFEVFYNILISLPAKKSLLVFKCLLIAEIAKNAPSGEQKINWWSIWEDERAKMSPTQKLLYFHSTQLEVFWPLFKSFLLISRDDSLTRDTKLNYSFFYHRWRESLDEQIEKVIK